MFRNLADNPLLLILLVLIIVLVFGANKLPGAARSLGRSMRIFKAEMRDMKDDTPPSRTEERPLHGRVIEHGQPRDVDETFEERRSRTGDTEHRDS